jgi:hypothetical protein
VAYVHTGINVWNLDKAANKLNLSIDEIIELAGNGEISLSIDVPPKMNVWLLTVNLHMNYMTLSKDINFSGIHLLPMKRDAVLLNLSKDDCMAFQSANPKICFFKSIYKYSNFYSSLGNPLFEFESDDNDNWPKTLRDKDTLTIDVHTDKREDKDYLNSIEKGLLAISGSNENGYGRRFVLFKDEFCMPENGTTLVDVEVQDIQESDLRIADQELSRFLSVNKEKKTEPAKPYFDLNAEVWCSNSFQLLLGIASHVCAENMDLKSMEEFYLANVDEVSEKLIKMKKARTKGRTEFIDYFFKLASSDSNFYDQALISKLKQENLEFDIDPKIPTVLKHLINYAKGGTKDVETMVSNVFLIQYSIKDDLRKLGLNSKLAKYAASIISRSARSERLG